MEILDSEIQVYLDLEGRVSRDERGMLYASFGLDALRAYEIGLLDEDQYRAVIEQMAARLHAADCEAFDLRGNHILLSFDVGGHCARDRDGEPALTLCNLEFVQGLYRPIR